MEPVRNHRNKLVVDAARLHRVKNRRESGQTLLEGPDLLKDAVTAGAKVLTVFGLESDERSREFSEEHDLRFTSVDQRALARLAGTDTPRGPITVVEIPTMTVPSLGNILVSYGVSNPGNVGALIRTAAAFGWGYAYTQGSADPWAPKALRAGAGGQFQTSVNLISSISSLGEVTVIATSSKDGVAPDEVGEGRLAVLIGEEAPGLPQNVVDQADLFVTIPMTGSVESLNVAVAAGIVVYALSNRSGKHLPFV